MAKKLLPTRINYFFKNLVAKNNHDINLYIKIKLPSKIDKLSQGYSEALGLAFGDSALRQLSQILRSLNIKPVYPFEGQKFRSLASKCDPLIFARYVNKYCLRYALDEILPREILETKKKLGNGGYEFYLL
jgi:hypothetical protein